MKDNEMIAHLIRLRNWARQAQESTLTARAVVINALFDIDRTLDKTVTMCDELETAINDRQVTKMIVTKMIEEARG